MKKHLQNLRTKKKEQIGEDSSPSLKRSHSLLVFPEIIDSKLQNKCKTIHQQAIKLLQMELAELAIISLHNI